MGTFIEAESFLKRESMVGVPGLEPGKEESESSGLPLAYTPIDLMVDLIGFEPTTSPVRGERSPN